MNIYIIYIMTTLDLGVLVTLGAVEVGVQLARGCGGHRDVQAVGVEAGGGQPPGALDSHTVGSSIVARTRGHHEHVSGGQEARHPHLLTGHLS